MIEGSGAGSGSIPLTNGRVRIRIHNTAFGNTVPCIEIVIFMGLCVLLAAPSVADPDPGSGAFLTPGSGIRNRFFPDPGSQTHIFESLMTIFWVKSSIIL